MAKLTLSHVEGTFAVLRLPHRSKPPDWLWESRFYSLTKTDDELSIVCDQSKIPLDIITSTNAQQQDDNVCSCCETGWGLFKVEGPLDFGLTGILNELTTPLAKAGISIFAISTYDTDYILVKEHLAYNAGYAWILDGHVVNGLPPRTTQDTARGPDPTMTTFEKDPMIKRMIELKKRGEGGGAAVGDAAAAIEETFGIVLVAGWIPSQTVQSAYNNNFLPAVQKCFQESDWKTKSSCSPKDIPNVYLYPSQYLHVTVATLHAFWRPIEEEEESNKEKKKKILQEEWTNLVEAASKREGWPKSTPLKLKLDSAQIGRKAGILLWKELTGGIDQMRICIQAEAKLRERQLIRVGIDPDTLSIPGIIHSTFLRFHEIPETPGTEIQEKFDKYVKQQIGTFFTEEEEEVHPITVHNAKLVCEMTPYMHVEDDERHVWATYPLSS